MVNRSDLHNNLYLGAGMRTLIYSSVLLFLVILSLPTTSEAFSRRSSSSEIGPTQATTAPLNQYTDVSAQSVPEPPVLMLMSIGLGVFGLSFALLRKS